MLLLVATLAAEILTDRTTTVLTPVMPAPVAVAVVAYTRLVSKPTHAAER